MTNKVFNKCRKALENENGTMKIVCIVLYDNSKTVKTTYTNIKVISWDNNSITFKYEKNDDAITIKRNFIKYILLGFFEDTYLVHLYNDKRYPI